MVLERMAFHEKSRYRAAAFRAARLYPGPVGELIAREIIAWEEFGYVLHKGGLIEQVVDLMLNMPLSEEVKNSILYPPKGKD